MNQPNDVLQSAPGPLAAGRISCIFIHVHDVQGMFTFYRDILGLRVCYAEDGLCAFLDLPNGEGPQIALYSGRERSSNAENHWFIIIDVPGIDAVAERLRRLGVAVGPIEPVPYGRAAQFKDPEGNVIEIHEPNSSAAAASGGG